MKPKKEKTTILFVHKGPHHLKPVQISSNLILNWKKYLAGLSLFFLCLIGTILYLIIGNTSPYITQRPLSTEVKTAQASVPLVDTYAVREKIATIDKQLSTIKAFLKARGIQTPYKGFRDGEIDNALVSTDELSDYYEDYLSRISYNISYTPLGLPYHGRITSTFGEREDPFGGSNVETHKGLDIKGPVGGQVKAMAKGEVEFAGQKSGFGNCIVLKHGNGFETLYGHLSKILVNVGQKIDIGDQIGLIGSTGRSTGPHLHYEVHRFGKKIDPQSFLNLN